VVFDFMSGPGRLPDSAFQGLGKALSARNQSQIVEKPGRKEATSTSNCRRDVVESQAKAASGRRNRHSSALTHR